MDEWKTFFRFGKNEQLAIFVLLALSAIMLIFSLFNDKWASHQLLRATASDSLFLKNEMELASAEVQKSLSNPTPFDPVQAVYSGGASTLNPFPFNPNQLSVEEWKRIGLSDRQIKTIKNYEAKGGKFYSKEDFSRMYSISREEYEVLAPFIRIPPADSASGRYSRFQKQLLTDKPDPAIPIEHHFIAINSTDSSALEALPLIGAWTAHRILKYRNSLGGFVNIEQLREIKDIDENKYQILSQFIQIDSTKPIPLKINRLSFNELIKHPYLEFTHVKKIISHRERRGFIRDYDALKTIAGLTDEELNKLIPYLSFE
ncbi:hypothetical protein MASR2M12_07960 [Bacteroidales bacterium]